MAETILIVDDEESVRQTFREWLEGAGLDCTIRVAADAEAALVQANQQTIDLAILDWNLGAGNDGLHLLEDLSVFSPDVVAILVTGFAHQATPLDAMRMGVRDYLDKNQDLNRTTFLASVRRQLERIAPAKRERRLHEGLVAFREAVDKVLPLVQSAAALNDPLPLPDAIGSLFRFLLRTTGARDGVLLVRRYEAARQPPEVCRVYDHQGKPLNGPLVPFNRSLASTVISMQEPCAMNQLEQTAAAGSLELQAFEKGRRSVLAVALEVAPGAHAVLELFDKPVDFTDADRQLVAEAGHFGAELLRQALAQSQSQRLLFDAVAAALDASNSLSESLKGTSPERSQQPPPPAVLDKLRRGLQAMPGSPVPADETLRLVEAVRVLALQHGKPAVEHCIRLVESLRDLLNVAAGANPI